MQTKRTDFYMHVFNAVSLFIYSLLTCLLISQFLVPSKYSFGAELQITDELKQRACCTFGVAWTRVSLTILLTKY